MMIADIILARRAMLGGFAHLGAGVALVRPGRALAQATFAPDPPVVPIIARNDRLFRVTVCTRPFRAAGPRIEVEQIGHKRVVHHYGHGGSGWSLSWGSALEAVPLALADGIKEVAVVGAGAIGMTTAITAQRMGAKVTIYAKERFPYVRSARATGSWTPDSRVGFAQSVGADFPDRWERMARASFQVHQRFLGMAGYPVEWTDRYQLGESTEVVNVADTRPRFALYEERLRDLTPQAEIVPEGHHPFKSQVVKKKSQLTFNVASLSHQLEEDFLLAGGQFVQSEFHEPGDFASIREKVIINCTGYAARALFKDETVVPVRGQIAWLIPQPGVTYGVYHDQLGILARRDGIVLQPYGPDDYFGFNDANEAPDYQAAYAAVAHAASLFNISA